MQDQRVILDQLLVLAKADLEELKAPRKKEGRVNKQSL